MLEGNSFDSKILDWEGAQAVVKNWQQNNEVIVFTNGCFDLLHQGHLFYLQEAQSCGNKLVVGLNSDSSVRALKGPERPIRLEEERALQLAALQFVDLVVVFEEETPRSLISMLLPDVLVKGGDWPVAEIVGSDIVINNGGTVKSLSFVKGFSSTNIIEKIRSKRP